MQNKFFLNAISAVLAAAASTAALAQKPAGLPGDFPNKPVRVLIGLAAGGGVDILVRATTQKLTEKWDSALIVENRPTAGGVQAMDAVAQATPDGYTWLASGSQLELSAVYKRVKFDVLKQIEPMAEMTSQPYLLVAHVSVPARNVKELISLAKSKPGALLYATAGPGSSGHLGHEYFNSLAGVTMTHVPYKGGGASLPDLTSGRVQLSFLTTLSGSALVKKGAVRALGVTSLKRLGYMPDVPTIAEQGMPEFEMSNTYGMFVTAGTPPAIIAGINREIVHVLNQPDLKATLEKGGAEVAGPHSPSEYRKTVAGNIARWTKVVKDSGINPDS
jgi:tripartite-type tricarboxylate transporter receptor subunit TctC